MAPKNLKRKAVEANSAEDVGSGASGCSPPSEIAELIDLVRKMLIRMDQADKTAEISTIIAKNEEQGTNLNTRLSKIEETMLKPMDSSRLESSMRTHFADMKLNLDNGMAKCADTIEDKYKSLHTELRTMETNLKGLRTELSTMETNLKVRYT